MGQTKKSQMIFDEIINKYRENSISEKNKGEKFERLMKAYLLTKPVYKNLLSDVWLWSEFPYKDQFGVGGKDTGIDIVCRTHDGEYWAVQCKCYKENATIDLHHVSTFITTASFPFNSKDGKKNFSHRIWIDTTYNGLNNEALNALNKIGCTRLGLVDLRNDDVNWKELNSGKKGDEVSIVKYDLRAHQKEAFDATIKYFQNHERGKLIMACGTGKTFTSLRISESLASDSHLVLFLVPSIALLSQTLKEWSAQSVGNIYPICICSDSQASAKGEDSISDLVLPATTDPEKVYKQFVDYRKRQKSKGGMIVVFSTYQSIDVISEVQSKINKFEKDSFIFDLIVCDEAHRTTGVKQKDKTQSAFTKVHDNKNIKAKKRLYMTATPRLYSSEAQATAKEKDTILWSMDDPLNYGDEIYRIGFGAAVEKQLLSDYKVIVLTLDENSVDADLQKQILDENSEIKADDAIKLIGCINVLSKRTNYLTDKELFSDVDPEPMRSAVAFCSNIKNSKYLRDSFKVCQQAYYEKMSEEDRADLVVVNADHVDGGMGSSIREEKLEWLKKSDLNKKECRVLNNVRCLSEGVDVPNLDAIMFLSSRNSQVDVVQSVGRVMRKAKGKKFGYIIIPVVVPSNSNADKILDNSEDFKIVWSVLNALRAHDDRFNATINKIELNKNKPKIIKVTGGGNFTGRPAIGGDTEDDEDKSVQMEIEFDDLQQKLYDRFEALSNQVFAKMVNKCGSKRYWSEWGKDVGEIAQRNIERINKLISKKGGHREKFNAYWEGLKKNLNPSVKESDAVEMLAQHMITKPVFEALFGNDHFTKENPVSKSLEDIVTLLDEKTDPEDLEKLERFYKSVQQRAEGIDNAEAKQKIVVELYDSFFKNAFPMTVEKLGIVYTPVEVVDFILHSTEYVLNKEFKRSISDEKVNVIDPFTGTGTFITRLLQSGIVKPKDLKRKYNQEIFANEIVLLAYYIASVNIENAFHELDNSKKYEQFSGICLTDTFQLYENEFVNFDDKIFNENSVRVREQKKKPITVIVGNPPYSKGQKSANDNAQNEKYPKLDTRIADTYIKLSVKNNTSYLLDSYVKAFRWASDRLNSTDGGVIAFVSNGAWLDNDSFDGFRKTIESEFSSIYVFNLRGNCRTSGELRKKEAGNVFKEGSRTPIAITILVKKQKKSGQAKIMYHDIGDYLSREDKLKIVSEFEDISNLPLKKITPNQHGDWLSKRNDKFSTFIPIEPQKKFISNSQSFYTVNSMGSSSNRDAWVYDYSLTKLTQKMKETISFYNSQVDDLRKLRNNNSNISADEFKCTDSKKISWCSSLIPKLNSLIKCKLEKEKIFTACYRPFVKEYLYFGEMFIHRRAQIDSLLPSNKHKNKIIALTGMGSNKEFSALITDVIPDTQLIFNGQCFPLYWYQTIKKEQTSFLENDSQVVRHEAISDFILERAQSKYGNKVQREDIFYYVYGILHSKSYRETFEADLKKMLPRIPLVSDYQKFWDFSKAGRELAELHLNYENIAPCPGVIVEGDEKNNFIVQKLKFVSKEKKDSIIYNNDIKISNIPEKAFEYVVNGRSAIEWIMDQYQITTHKESGIIKDPNDWAIEHNQPRYILDLLLSVINVSVQTVEIVNSLPDVDWEKE